MINAQTWMVSFPDLKTTKIIYGTKDFLKRNLQGTNIQELSGDLTIDSLGNLEELDLWKSGKLDNITIRNCPKLKIINLGNSGVKKLNLGPGLDGLLRLDVSVDFITESSRKLSELDLSNVKNLKVLKCHGELATKLIGFEKLVQLQHFDTTFALEAKNVVTIPTNEFSKWKDKLDTITGSNGLDLLKGGSGSDKDEVDSTKLDGYKNRPTQGQLDKELDKIKNLLGITNGPLPPDWDTRLIKKSELEAANYKVDKGKEWIKIVDEGLKSRYREDWKEFLEKEKILNQIEQQLK